MKSQYDIKKYDSIITKIFLAILITIVILSFYACTVYKQPKMQITSVLAVTAEGDTLKLPIDVIRPIYNYNTYPTNRYPVAPNYFYYSPHRYRPVYGNSNYSNNSNVNNNTNINNTVPVNPIINKPVVNPPQNNNKKKAIE